jgi:hypothetical protein
MAICTTEDMFLSRGPPVEMKASADTGAMLPSIGRAAVKPSSARRQEVANNGVTAGLGRVDCSCLQWIAGVCVHEPLQSVASLSTMGSISAIFAYQSECICFFRVPFAACACRVGILKPPCCCDVHCNKIVACTKAARHVRYGRAFLSDGCAKAVGTGATRVTRAFVQV